MLIAPAAFGARPPAAGLSIERLAWAGVRLRVGTVDVFVDAIAPDPAPGPPLEAGAGRCFALATHHHGDHLDLDALQAVLGARGYLVAHEDVLRFADARKVKVQPVRAYEPVFLSRDGREFVAWCVPASDGFGSPQYSWVVDGGGRRVIHCGDTLWHGAWWDIARAYGPFDLAFLPISGARQLTAGEVDVGQPIVMNPEQAAGAAKVLQARLAVPIHYGGGDGDGVVEVPDAEQRFAEAAAGLGVRVQILTPGQSISV